MANEEYKKKKKSAPNGEAPNGETPEEPEENTHLSRSQRVESLNIVALTEIFAECLTGKEISKLLAIFSLISSTLGYILIQRGESLLIDIPQEDIVDEIIEEEVL